MLKKFCWVVTVSLIFAVVSFVGAAAQEDTQATENAPTTGGTPAADAAGEMKLDKTVCLACHGSYDDLAAATADYKAPSGETVTPHQYVPHKEDPEIPECTECHKPHPIPPESKDQVVKPTKIDWCYATCHHMNNLMPCKGCH
jgi:hypothetical protein